VLSYDLRELAIDGDSIVWSDQGIDDSVALSCDFAGASADCTLDWWTEDTNTNCVPRVEDEGTLVETLVIDDDPCRFGGIPQVTVSEPDASGVVTLDIVVPSLQGELCPDGVPDGTEVRFELWLNETPTLSAASATTSNGAVSITIAPGSSSSTSIFFAEVDAPIGALTSQSVTLDW